MASQLCNQPNLRAWLKNKGYQETSPNVFENESRQYELRMQTFRVRDRLSPRRWSGAKSHKYSDRYITAEGKLGYMANR
jgi:hypothetical protein